MAGEAEPSAPVTVAGAPQESPAASPVVAAPVATPEPAAAPVTPEPAAVEPAPAALVEPAAPVAEPTLLQKFDKENKPVEPAKPAVDPAKPADPAKPVETKPVEPVTPDPAAKPAEPSTPATEPAALEPIEYAYTLPDTIKLDDATKTSFHSALDAVRADPEKGAQGLIDLHNQTMEQYAQSVADNQVKVWNDTRRSWVTDVMADEELGGAGYQTTMGSIARMRDLLVPESRRGAFEQMLQITGVGDHPEFLRLLHNAARIYDEAPMPPPGPRPPADIGRVPGARGLRSMYKSNRAQ